MHLKKVYLEITNGCNLNCDFRIKNQRKITNITYDNYKLIIDKIKSYTDELYLHVLGEPLMHKEINNFINYAYNQGLLVNITTNGYLIKNIKDNIHIHRLNVSIHSYNEKYGVSIDNYLANLFDIIDNLRTNTFVSLRLWVNNKYNQKILAYINERYHTNYNKINNNQKIKITNNLIIDTFHEFIWPDLNNNYYNKQGRCKWLIDHIGILSDGTIIPCCLDAKGVINLGNIYESNLDDIFNSNRVKSMREGFKKGYKYQELCRHCQFLE